MKKIGLALCLTGLLSACTFAPTPPTITERFQQANLDVKQLFAQQENLNGGIDFYQALALALNHNLDYRVKLTNTALQARQLKIAELAMFPALNTTGSVYSRNNDYSTFGTTSTGAPTDVLNSTPRTVRSARIGLSWNILDFGLGYVQAQQQGERILIAEEEARRQQQELVQDVRVAYWKAYSAQQLLQDTEAFQQLLNKAKQQVSVMVTDKTIPKEDVLKYQAALLESNRQLIQLNYKLNKAMFDLKHLLNVPPEQTLTLLPPPVDMIKVQHLNNVDFTKLDAVALVNRPELRAQHYQKNIAKLGVRTAILQALPGVNLAWGWNYNSNQFLLNNTWLDRSVDVSWNLLNLASLPITYKTAKTQAQYEKLKTMALTLTVLTETRYAYSHYENLVQEYEVAHKMAENSAALYHLTSHRHQAALASTQQLVLAKLHMITAKMDEDLVLADLATAQGELYLSAGIDLLPDDTHYLTLTPDKIKQAFAQQNTMDFNQQVDHLYEKIFAQAKTTA